MTRLTKEEIAMWKLRVKEAPEAYRVESDMIDTIDALEQELSSAKCSLDLIVAIARQDEFRDTVIMCTTFSLEQIKTLIKQRADHFVHRIARLENDSAEKDDL